MKRLPNILTLARLALSLFVFGALIAIGGDLDRPFAADAAVQGLARAALAAFVVASVTDFFDGWIARRFDATSLLGAILDPIADKVLVCGAVIGLAAVGAPGIYAAGGLILFREFGVSALREVLAPMGLRLPVTALAKTKTALQLLALGFAMVVRLWPCWGVSAGAAFLLKAEQASLILLALATVITLWTGIDYARAAARALARPNSRG